MAFLYFWRGAVTLSEYGRMSVHNRMLMAEFMEGVIAAGATGG